jgi:hypothetical protein
MAPDLREPAPRTPAAHSVGEIESQLAALWARTAAERTSDATARILAARSRALAAARAAAAAADELETPGERHVAARSSVLNLIVVAGSAETAESCAAMIAGSAGRRPSRSLILSAADPEGPAGLEARVDALPLTSASGRVEPGSETIHVKASGETGRHLASIIVPLLVHDLPVALWWPDDPQLSSHRADRLLPLADMLIVDGSSWSDDGLDRLAALARVAHARGLAVVDFALLRQARWREAIASVYDLPDLRPHLRAVRSITVEYSASGHGPELTNVVRPVYHVAWLASRLGMSVVTPLQDDGKGHRSATLRQRDHAVEVVLRPATSGLGGGSTVRVQIQSRRRGVELVGDVTAGDHDVDVSILENSRERVRRTFLAPRLTEVELFGRAVDTGRADPVTTGALAIVGPLLAGHDAAEGDAQPDDGPPR